MTKHQSTEDILADIKNKLQVANAKLKSSNDSIDENQEQEANSKSTQMALNEIKNQIEDDIEEEEPMAQDHEDILEEEEEYMEEEKEEPMAQDHEDILEEEEEYMEEEKEEPMAQDHEDILEEEEEYDEEDEDEEYIEEEEEEEPMAQDHEYITEEENRNDNYLTKSDMAKTISSILDEKLKNFAQTQAEFKQNYSTDKNLTIYDLVNQIAQDSISKWIDSNQHLIVKIIEDVAEKQISEAINKIKIK